MWVLGNVWSLIWYWLKWRYNCTKFMSKNCQPIHVHWYNLLLFFVHMCWYFGRFGRAVFFLFFVFIILQVQTEINGMRKIINIPNPFDINQFEFSWILFAEGYNSIMVLLFLLHFLGYLFAFLNESVIMFFFSIYIYFT